MSELYPWIRHTGCPDCKAKPRQQCPTETSHPARIRLWGYLWLSPSTTSDGNSPEQPQATPTVNAPTAKPSA